ncbi:MAG: oligosaccharide flippase family protein, partial [Oscillospiraceae bacterium]|nr:oligosaccharide flippase family protein [Oscillospiraceae bacterium]
GVLDMGVTGYVLSFIVSDFLSFAGLTIVAGLHKYLDFKYFSKRLWKDMLKYSAPLIPTYVLWWITSSSDRWIVTMMCGEGINGVYSVANKIPTLLMMFTTVFFQAWQMSAIENRNDAGLSKFYTKVYGAYSSLLMIAAAGIILFVKPLTYLIVHGKQFVHTLVGYNVAENFLYSYNYTPILVIAMIFQCLCQFTSSVYNVRKKSINSMATSFIAAAVNIVLNFWLIPKYGAYGAAIATAASYGACFAVRIFDVRRIIPFKARNVRLVVNTLLVCGMAYISIVRPRLTYLWLILIFMLVTAFNFASVISTLKQIFNRRRG